jgi:hypothetical protein
MGPAEGLGWWWSSLWCCSCWVKFNIAIISTHQKKILTVTVDNRPFDERIGAPMRERNKYRENLKSLFDEWKADFDNLKELQKDSEGALKNLKQRLENSWTAFEKGFE